MSVVHRIEPPQPGPTWNGVSADERRMAESSLTRFLGGSPLKVLVRLVFVSLIVGALLMWLDIRPTEIFSAIERLVMRLWNLGFGALRLIFDYVLAGAVIVIPVWFILRLLNSRSAR
jgi:hypothetical protein